MELVAAPGDPYRSARDDYATVATRLTEQLSDRVAAVLDGDREELVRLLMIAADTAWQSRAAILGTVQEVADATHALADDVADCYSAGTPPSDRLCDTGFAVADRVDALAIEVLTLRSRLGDASDRAPAAPRAAPAREARHLARAHLAALRDAAAVRRRVTPEDVSAAHDLYDAVVQLGRRLLHAPHPAALDET